MKIALVFIILLSGALAFAQPGPDTLWTLTFGGGENDAVVEVIPAANDGYLVISNHQLPQSPSYGIVLTMVSDNGYILWARTLPALAPNMEATGAVPVSTGGYLIIASTSGGYTPSVLLVRLTATGDTLWTRWRDFSNPGTVCESPDRGFVYITTSSWWDWYYGDLNKADSLGMGGWGHSYFWVQWSMTLSRVRTIDDGYIAAGSYLLRTDLDGDSLWTRPYGGGDVLETSDHGFIMVGNDYIQGMSYLRIRRTDENGDTLWTRLYQGGPVGVVGGQLLPLASGGHLIGGTATVGASQVIYLMEVDDTGDSLWARTYGSQAGGYTQFAALAAGIGGGYLIGGMTRPSLSATNDCYLIRTGSDAAEADLMSVHLPSARSLSSFPNPFNPTTTLSFTLPRAGKTKIVIYDITGREVRTVSDQVFEAGEHQIRFDGSALPSGIYFGRMQSGEFVATQKLLLLK